MPEDLQQLGADLIATAARVVRWAPKDGVELSLAATRVLARLFDAGPLRISDLAARERCSQPTISNHIQRLERAGLVSRGLDTADGRVSVITLTQAGLDELVRIRELIGHNLSANLAKLSEDDLRDLRVGIEAMRKLLSET